MFIVRIDLDVRPEHRDALRAVAAEDGPTARGLPGCVDYTFCEDVLRPERVLLYEEWRSRAEFEAYRASLVFTQMGARLRPLLNAPPKSAYYESDDVFAQCAVPRTP